MSAPLGMWNRDAHGIIRADGSAEPLATVRPEHPDAEAIANLIVAAPVLLNAVNAFVAQYQGNGHDDREGRPEMMLARIALAIVKGEA